MTNIVFWENVIFCVKINAVEAFALLSCEE